MTGLSCAQVRAYLASLQAGHPTADAATFAELAEHGAVSGSPASPSITPVGRHVLTELELRAYRVDSLSLEFVAGHLDRILTDLNHVAKTAEYFLAELGPVTPPEAVPLLRPVAVSLANRRETPEELAEDFRGNWGAMEVMGGPAADRLLAAELLCASSAEISTLYGPMNQTVQLLREQLGESGPAVTVATLLHLEPRADGTIALAEYRALRSVAGGEEAAAVLAAGTPDAAEATRRLTAAMAALAAAGVRPDSGSAQAAVYLAAVGAESERTVPRVATILHGLAPHLPRSAPAAAVLALNESLSPEEILDWVAKSREIAKSHLIAPSGTELTALGASLVAGLPPEEFSPGFDARGPPPVPLAALLALHAWVYRPLLSKRASPAPSPVPPVGTVG